MNKGDGGDAKLETVATLVGFVVLISLIVFVIHQQVWGAFKANPPLNALIVGVLVIGIILSFRQVIRLFPEVAWVNNFRMADPGITTQRAPALLAPMAAILGDRIGRMTISTTTMRSILDSIAVRLDSLLAHRRPAREGVVSFGTGGVR